MGKVSTGVRFVGLCLLIGATAWATAGRLGETFLPLTRAEIQWLNDTFRVESLALTRAGGEPIFRLEVTLAKPLTVDGRTYYPDPRGKAVSSTLVGNAVLPITLFLAALFALPAPRPRDYLFRLLTAVPGLPLLWAIGVPMTLLAGVWRFVFAATQSTDYPFLLLWDDFLQEGGANVLGIAAGLFLAWVTSKMMSDRAPNTLAHSGNGTSTGGLPNVPSVAVSSQAAKRGSEATMPPPIVPNS
jgi:hypothetical protein